MTRPSLFTRGWDKRIGLAVLVLSALLAAGCTTPVAVVGPVHPSIVPSERLPYRVAVVFPESMGDFGVSVRSGRTLGIPQSLYFDYGDVLWDALFRSVVAVYNNATAAVAVPRSGGQYDRIIKFLVQDVKASGSRSSLTAANDLFAISVKVDMLDGKTLEPLHHATVQRSVTYAGSPQDFDKVIENVIQELANGITKLLSTEFVEKADPSPP